MAVAAPVADSSAALKMPAGTRLADQVKAQLSGDYPPSALSWVDSVAWAKPSRVPLAQIDFTAGQADWDAAAADKAKLDAFRKRMAGAGWWKPAVVLRLPGKQRLFVCDGHGRILTSKALGLPVLAYVGTAKAASGPWQSLHSQQLAGDVDAVELAVSPGGRSMDTSPFSASTTSNWVARGGGLPDYVRGVAHALLRKGRARDESHAIEMAIGLMQDWASGRTPNGKGHVHPAVQAAAAKAMGEWEALRAHAHASDTSAIELAGAFNSALHPRVGAGFTAGGQFAPKAGAQQSPAAQPATSKSGAAKHPGTHGQRAARARQLRAQADKYREHAQGLRLQIRQINAQIHAALTRRVAARKAAARSAAAAASGKQGAKKVKAKTSTKAHRRKAAHHKGPSVNQLRLKVYTLRDQARKLDAAARKLDAQAAKL